MKLKPVNPVYTEHDLLVRQFLASMASAFGGEVIYRSTPEETPQDSLSNLTTEQLETEAASIPFINPDLPDVVATLTDSMVDENEMLAIDVHARVLERMGWKLDDNKGWHHPLLSRRDALVGEIIRRKETADVERVADEIIKKFDEGGFSLAKTEPTTEEGTPDQSTLF